MQISRYGEMLKTHIEKAKVYVTARFKNEGSVLRETMQAEALGVETRGDIDSRRRKRSLKSFVTQKRVVT